MSQTTEKDHFWKPRHFALYQEALAQGVTFTVTCPLRLNGKNVSAILTGHLLTVQNNVVNMAVQSTEVLAEKTDNESTPCSFSFCLKRSRTPDSHGHTGFSGTALIIEMQRDALGMPATVEMHLASHSVLRKVQREKCVGWQEEKISRLGLTIVADMPATNQELRETFNAYYQDRNADGQLRQSRLLNISPGGACLEVDPDLADRLLLNHEHYFFFLLPIDDDTQNPPYIFMGKKAGLSHDHDIEPNRSALRIRFIYELHWSADHSQMQWARIETEGSQRLRDELRVTEETSTDNIAS